MEIAILLGEFSIGCRPINFDDIWNNSRGLTGSEITFMKYAVELTKIGHTVSIFTRTVPGQTPGFFKLENKKKINLYDISDFNNKNSSVFEVVISFNEPDPLRFADPKSLRVVNQQLTNFSYCNSGFDDYVDLYISPSENHMNEMLSHNDTTSSKWIVIHNGVDRDFLDESIEKINGRVIYASSPDRGLHLLFQEWPKIKKQAKNASLRVFYDFDNWYESIKNNINSENYKWRESAKRAIYIKSMLEKLSDMDVEIIGSVSRNEIRKRINEAQIMAYPCDTICYTEGFSIAVMEACASKTLPITSKSDALGSVYENIIPMVDTPVMNNIDKFSDFIIEGINNDTWRKEIVEKAYAHSKKFAWDDIVNKLDNVLKSHCKVKNDC